MACLFQGLREDVSGVCLCRDVVKCETVAMHQVSEKEMPQFNVFGPSMEDRVVRQVDGANVVSVQGDR